MIICHLPRILIWSPFLISIADHLVHQMSRNLSWISFLFWFKSTSVPGYAWKSPNYVTSKWILWVCVLSKGDSQEVRHVSHEIPIQERDDDHSAKKLSPLPFPCHRVIYCYLQKALSSLYIQVKHTSTVSGYLWVHRVIILSLISDRTTKQWKPRKCFNCFCTAIDTVNGMCHNSSNGRELQVQFKNILILSTWNGSGLLNLNYNNFRLALSLHRVCRSLVSLRVLLIGGDNLIDLFKTLYKKYFVFTVPSWQFDYPREWVNTRNYSFPSAHYDR